jgi:DNA-binding NarL/FixJ family response regulator
VSVRVLLIDSHPVVRVGLRTLLPVDEFTVVAQAHDGAEAIDAAERQQPDVVLLEADLPDRPGPAVCAAILERAPRAAVIVFSANRDDDSTRAAVEAGARGYLLKDAESLDLAEVIRRVLEGENVFDQRVAGALVPSGTPSAGAPKLSERELNVLRLAAEGLTNSEIGARLYLSRHTVKEYLSHAMRKLNVTNRVEAVLRASRLGLIEKAALAEDSRLDRELREPDAALRIKLSDGEPGISLTDPEIAVPPVKLGSPSRRTDS